MTNKEYREMLRMVSKLQKLIEKYEEYLELTSLKEEQKHIKIHPDVYDDICDALGRDYIGLMGIS